MSAAQGISAMSHRLRHLAGLGSTARPEPSDSLFLGIRWRLTVWYSAVLAVVLVLAGIILYVSMRQTLLGPVDTSIRQEAQGLGQVWQGAPANLPGPACAARDFAPSPDILYVCFDASGDVLGQGFHVPDLVPNITSPSLVGIAIRNGQAETTEPSGSPLGMVEVYALKVPAAQGRSTLGVVETAQQVGPQLQALVSLLRRMLELGALTLLLAAVGGLVLANRALLPARLAHARQRDFIADASHELRTPLTMIRSMVDVVLRGRQHLPVDDVALLEDVVREASSMAALTDGMLNLAQLDAGRVHIEEDIVDLNGLAHDMARRVGPMAAERAIRVKAEDGPPALVLGDRVLLDHAVLVLTDNAIKYSRPGGEVTLHTGIVEGEAVLAVRDTGVGIAAEHLPHLGERFYRVEKARSRAAGGAGLGISIAQAIASRHRGTVKLSSAVGRGTTATLSLPAVKVRAANPSP